jgi:multidrug efflux pump subunit AcrA (membrane-fusion protein)
MIQAGNELLRHASSISPNPRPVRGQSHAGIRLRPARFRFIFVLSLAAVITVIASGLGCSSEKPAEPTVSVQVVPVKKATIEQTVTSEAVLFPLAQSAIVPKISAPIKAFYVNRGSKVHAGQLLATL